MTIVKSTFAGEMPQWLYETFQKSDGSLDYEAIWDAVKALGEKHVRLTVVCQLKDEFGGYCSDREAYTSAFIISKPCLALAKWQLYQLGDPLIQNY